MLCHHYKCIFIHIPKAAGQSVEQVFLKALDLDWNTRAPLLLMPNDNPLLGPQSLAHLTAQEYVDKKYMTAEQFSSYFKFTFVRNPYERLVSTYIYFDYIKRYDFNYFIKEIVTSNLHERYTRHFLPQTIYLTNDDGLSLVDFIGRMENLQNDFLAICKTIGLSNASLPHTNKTKTNTTSRKPIKKILESVEDWNTRKRRRPTYFDYYDKEAFDLTNSLYEADFVRFGYEMRS